MHLEGKLHTGYQKIRKVVAELKQKREEERRLRDKERRDGKRRSRSRTNSPPRHTTLPNRNKPAAPEKVDDQFYFSSRKFGSGVGVPSE
jgi:hypothetical protein